MIACLLPTIGPSTHHSWRTQRRHWTSPTIQYTDGAPTALAHLPQPSIALRSAKLQPDLVDSSKPEDSAWLRRVVLVIARLPCIQHLANYLHAHKPCPSTSWTIALSINILTPMIAAKCCAWPGLSQGRGSLHNFRHFQGTAVTGRASEL